MQIKGRLQIKIWLIGKHQTKTAIPYVWNNVCVSKDNQVLDATKLVSHEDSLLKKVFEGRSYERFAVNRIGT